MMQSRLQSGAIENDCVDGDLSCLHYYFSIQVRTKNDEQITGALTSSKTRRKNALMRCAPLAVLALLCVLGFSSVALADDDDVVMLKNGGRVVGKVVIDDPQEGVTVKILEGQVKKIPRSEIQSVEYATRKSAPKEAAKSTGSLGGPLLTLETSNTNVVLEKIIREGAYAGSSSTGVAISMIGMEWETVCTVPCGKNLDPNAKYRVAGSGVTPTYPFLVPRQDKLTLKVDPGSNGAWTAGLVFTSLGAGVATSGIIFYAVFSAIDPASESSKSTWDTMKTAGLVMMVSGGVMLVGGIVMMVQNRTVVTTDDGKRLAKMAVPLGPVTLTPRGLAF